MLKSWKKNWLILGLVLASFFLVISPQPTFAQDDVDVEDQPIPPAYTVGGAYQTRDFEDYFVYPLVLDPSQSLNGTGKLRDTIIYNMVRDQGYELHCPSGGFTINSSAYGAIEKYFQLYSSATLGNTDSEKNDIALSKVAMFRGDENEKLTSKITSFEGFFSALKLGELDKTRGSGAINHLLSSQEQCAAKINNLRAASTLCDTQKGKPCALDKPIFDESGATLTTTLTLLGKIEKLLTKKNHFQQNFSCYELSQDAESLETNGTLFDFGISRTAFEAAQTPLNNLPLNFEKAYRLAYLVISPLQDPKGGGIPNFWFLNDPAKSSKQHAPIFVALKIPDFGTSRSEAVPSLDASHLTSQLIRSDKVNTELKELELQRRDALLGTIKAKQADRLSGSENLVLNCSDTPQCSTDADGVVVDLKEALVDIINGYGETCDSARPEDLREEAGIISTPGKVDTSNGRIFKKEFFSGIIPQTQNVPFTWQFKVNSAAEVKKGIPGGIQVRAHLLAPLGVDLALLNDALRIVFSPDKFDLAVLDNCLIDAHGACGVLPEFYPLRGSAVGYTSKDTIEYHDPDKPCPENDRGCDNASFSIELKDTAHQDGLHIIGARLGWMIRKFQESLWQVGSKAHDYLLTCERAEDLFIGRCGQDRPSSTFDKSALVGKNNGSDNCEDYKNTSVDLPSYDKIDNIVADTAKKKGVSAQLLWGIMQIEGSPILRKIRAKETSMSCGDLIINDYGASQIMGILVPACAQGAAKARLDNMGYPNPGIEAACSFEGAIEAMSDIVVSETSYIESLVPGASEQQILYMTAGRHLGLDPEILKNPGCEGAPPVQGCGGLNYCQCAVDGFKFEP